jgi:probable rRNA maturation factor
MGSEPPPLATGPRKAGHEGDLEVFVADEQVDIVLDATRYGDLARMVLQAEGVRGDVEFALIFVDEASMAQLNTTHMGGSGATDVLAFPIDDEMFQTGRSPDAASRRPAPRDGTTSRGPLLLGDVVVCPLIADRQAVANTASYIGHDGTVEAEMDLLVVHGILHVLGHDHLRAEDQEVMQLAERKHLGAFRSAGGNSQ